MITIVIASYKYGHLASHCIESILSQTKQPDKILFIDDGVGDCFKLKELYPNIEYIFRKSTIGTVANFQSALLYVPTDKVMFLGADNWLRSDAVEILSKSTANIVTYDIIVTGELKDEIKNRHLSEITKYNGDWYWDRSKGHHGSMLYNTEIAKKSGGYAASGGTKTEEDMVLYNRMLNIGATREHIKEGLLYYRRHKENFNKY